MFIFIGLFLFFVCFKEGLSVMTAGFVSMGSKIEKAIEIWDKDSTRKQV